MIIPHISPPTPWARKTISSDKDYEQLDRALEDMVEEQWIDDFIKRLNYAIEDIVRKK
jgi:hypothetical protein